MCIDKWQFNRTRGAASACWVQGSWAGPWPSGIEGKAIKMLRFLTQKLKLQSLNEVRPFLQKQELPSSKPVQVSEDHDSGTESDDENVELQEISKVAAEEDSQAKEAEAPTVSSESPGFSHSMTKGKSRFHLDTLNSVSPFEGDEFHDQSSVDSGCLPNDNMSSQCRSSMDSGCLPNDNLSSQCSSDFERYSLDYEPGSSIEFEHNSSEEELAGINKHRKELQAEKRTWSQANHRGSCLESSGSSSDEEVRDLLCKPQPVTFRSSPPKGVHRLRHELPRIFLANVMPASHICSVSPRKKHRLTSFRDLGSQSSSARPCLDFEKMQKTLLKKHMSHGFSRARIVKVKSFNGSNRPPKLMCDPAVFSFRSISMAYNPLTPVEEPTVAF